MADQFKNFMTNLGIQKPKRQGVGFDYAPTILRQDQEPPGAQLKTRLEERRQLGGEKYIEGRSEQTGRVARDIAEKSAFGIPVDEFGQVKKELTNLRPAFTKQIESATQRGKAALQTEEAKTAWHAAKTMQDLGQFGFTGTITANGTDIPGAKGDNPGARAVSLAMKAKQSGTPYVWAGNSLTKGVDCSGLVQQVYRQLGITVPRTTYEQAKHGKQVSINALRPGDLVFYRPESRGPGHVAIFVGNGKVVHAANTRLGIITSNLVHSNGVPLSAVRPY